MPKKFWNRDGDASMSLVFLIGILLWGWAEISAFIYIGSQIGGLLTLLGIFGTAIVGLSLLKSQGGVVIAKIRVELAQGRTPVGSIADSISMAAGGILMLIPGYVTDSIGVLLFIPVLRTISGAWILHQLVRNNRFKNFVHVSGRDGFATDDPQSFHETGEIIEGDVTERQSPKDHLNKH